MLELIAGFISGLSLGLSVAVLAFIAPIWRRRQSDKQESVDAVSRIGFGEDGAEDEDDDE